MFATLALALVAAAPAADRHVVVYTGHAGYDTVYASLSTVGTGPVVGTVVAPDDGVIGTMVYTSETGRLYGQGEDEAGRWVLNGWCEDGTCEVEVVAFTGTSVATAIASATAASFRSGETITVGPLAFKVEWGGERVGCVTVDQVQEGPDRFEGLALDEGITLTGIALPDTGELLLSWLPEDGSTRAALMIDAQCGLTDAGALLCEGDADLWLEAGQGVTTLGYWGYEHMTTVKGWKTTTLPHRDGMLIE